MIEEDTAQCVTSYEPLCEETVNQRTPTKSSTSLSFSLQIITGEGLSIRGDATMQKTPIGVPQRASRPVQQIAPDIDLEYDDDNVAKIPRSALRHRPIQNPPKQQLAAVTPPANTPNTGPIVAPSVVPTRRVTGGTRVFLWILLFLCIAFLVDGVVIPAYIAISNQFIYGTNRIAPFDLDQHHFLTQETHNTLRITVTSADGKHVQVLTMPISGVSDHALVTLSEDGNDIGVAVNGLSITPLVPDGHGMYQWKEG